MDLFILSIVVFLSSFQSFRYLALFAFKSSIKPENSLTIYNSKAGDYGLGIGLIWWIIGMVFVIGYFVYTFYMFRGKVRIGGEH